MTANFERLALETSPAALFSRPPQIRFQTEAPVCACGGALLVQKSRRKDVVSMFGPFAARETVLFCSECGTIYYSEGLRAIVPRGCNVGYDVLLFVGRALFQRHRTVQETLSELAERNVHISASEVNHLGRRFILLLAQAHRRAVPRIREEMTLSGGYILHLDAMHAGGAPVLMSGVDGLSRIVLGNVKLPGESAESIRPFLENLKKRFGVPVGCVHDMGPGICNAVAKVFGGVPDFICHFHFLRDAGTDILEPSYALLRKQLRRHGISTRLHELARKLARQLGDDKNIDCEGLARSMGNAEELPDPGAVPAAAAYSLVQWALRGKQVGDGYGFPFDRPLACFAERLLELNRRLPDFIDVFPQGEWRDNRPLYKLSRELSRVAQDPRLRSALKELRWRSELFDSLRSAMRIAPPNGNKGLNDEGTPIVGADIRSRVLEFRHRLKTDPKRASDKLCVKLIEQIDKYGDKLFADPIVVHTKYGPMEVQPQRTNNIMEQFFRGIRRKQCRRSGNDTMTRTLQTMLADSPLVKNLDNPRYMSILLDGRKSLEELFVELDEQTAAETKTDSSDRFESRQMLPGFISLVRLPDLPKKIAKLFFKLEQRSKSN